MSGMLKRSTIDRDSEQHSQGTNCGRPNKKDNKITEGLQSLVDSNKILEPFLEASEADDGQHEIKIEEAQTDREAGSDFTLCAVRTISTQILLIDLVAVSFFSLP